MDIDGVTKEELDVELEKGYAEMMKENTISANQAFANICTMQNTTFNRIYDVVKNLSVRYPSFFSCNR